ncbi:hypothetical protein BLNAU_17162 [Blattamonas nauphoetae]|uniref:Uncharacterized protein n=1 Tax=Blattamonas nauphoetae TaxID=2049346 RepID=A0ABQ9XCJ4_9EUKA|nr:hypothetical protein BLNAU_17162 [Blattamonas nauphoetae]
MITLSLLLCLSQSFLTATSEGTNPTNQESLLDTLSNTPDTTVNEIQRMWIPERSYFGHNIDVKQRFLELSGEQSNERSSPETHIVTQCGFKSNRNEEELTMNTCESCIFSLTNSTLSLKSLHFSLVSDSRQSGQEKNNARAARLAIVSGSILTISESIIELPPSTSPVLISPSTIEESTAESSVVVQKCSISSESVELHGFVETSAFPSFEGPISVSLVGCSFSSLRILGKDGIGLSLTRSPRKSEETIETISSSLIGCSFVNMSSIGSSCQPHLPHLSQKMLGCVVSLSSSHLSGSTIRDFNNGGSVLCLNCSFSSLLSSFNVDSNADGTIINPNGTFPFNDNGTSHYWGSSSIYETITATFRNCRFTGAKYASNKRPIHFYEYKGSISIVSCSFSNHIAVYVYDSIEKGGIICFDQPVRPNSNPVIVQGTNFTNIQSDLIGSALYARIAQTTTFDDCKFENCGSPNNPNGAGGGLYISCFQTTHLTTLTNLVFQSCSSTYNGAMAAYIRGPLLLSNCRFEDCTQADDYASAGGLSLSLLAEATHDIRFLDFTDCTSDHSAGGLDFWSNVDVQLSELHFVRCTSGIVYVNQVGGGFVAYFAVPLTLTVKDCSFDHCSSTDVGAAFSVERCGNCVVIDCAVRNCSSRTAGTNRILPERDSATSLSLTRVAFIDNTVGQEGLSSESVNGLSDTTAFVDVYLNYLKCDTRPTIEIVDCYTTCATNSIGMHMTTNRGTSDESTIRVIDEDSDCIAEI